MSRRYGRAYDGELLRGVVMMVIFIVAFLTLCLARPINKVTNIREIEGTVTEKAVKRGHNDDKYMIFILNDNDEISTLEITDSLFRLRFDSSDVYAGIEVGKNTASKWGAPEHQFSPGTPISTAIKKFSKSHTKK